MGRDTEADGYLLPVDICTGATGRSASGVLYTGELTLGLTSYRVSSSAGKDARRACASSRGQRWLSQVASSRACRITGIRVWIWAMSSFASMVRMAKVV